MPIQCAPSGLAVPAGVLPRVQARLAEFGVGDRVHQAVPPADLDQADHRDRNEAGEDDEELEHLVVDRPGQAADGDVRQHDRRADHDRRPERPAEQRLHDEGQRVEVHAGDQHLGDGEAERVEQVGGAVESQPQVLRHAADLGAVVEGHHHDAQEDHRRDRADPVVVDRHHAVLGPVRGHSDDLQRAQVRRDEGETGHPGRQGAAGEEEVDAGPDRPAGGEADPEDGDEVQRQNQVVQAVHVEPKTVAVHPVTPRPDVPR